MSKLFNHNYDLTLTNDGKIIYKKWVYDEEARKSEHQLKDVTDKAIRVMHRDVQIEEGFKLRHLMDIVCALEEQTITEHLFVNCFISSFVEYYKKLKDSYVEPEYKYDPDGVEYIKLYWSVEMDDCIEGSYISGIERASMGGDGWVLLEDKMEEWGIGYHKGTRIAWGVSMSPLEDLLHLPIRLDEQLHVREDMRHWKKGDQKILLDGRKSFTLKDVIEGVFWELSFCGTPEDTAKTKEEIMQSVKDIKEGNAKLRNIDELIAELEQDPENKTLLDEARVERASILGDNTPSDN